jgi:uncharacterized RDD family membrane protein YckC
VQDDYALYPLATFKQRAGAALFDVLLSFIIITFVSFIVGHFFHHHDGSRVGPTLLFVSFIFAYYFFPLFASGETVGKKLFRVRVVSETDDGELSFVQVIGRECAGKVLSLLSFGYGFLGALNRKDRKTFHDRLFSTRVITFR